MRELALPNDRFGLWTDVGPLAIVKWIGLVRLERQIDDFDELPLDDLRYVYRKPKPGHSGDEARQGSGVNL